MAYLEVPVSICDPVLSSRRVAARRPGVDTWHDHTLIVRHLLDQLGNIGDQETASLSVSGGMEVTVASAEVGLVIGSIVIERLRVLVVDDGAHDVLLGSDIFDHAFSVARPGHSEVRLSSDWKDDPEALAVELYPVRPPLELQSFIRFLDSQRVLHNIALVASGAVSVGQADAALSFDDDSWIDPDLRLKLTWIDSGSIWVTLKSGSKAALGYVGRFFEKGASARLAQEVAAAQDATNQADINRAVRDATIDRMKAEQDRLRAENLAATHDVWRQEALHQVDWLDELVSRVEDENVRAALKQRRDAAIRQMVDQPVVPIVRNLPREPEARPGFMLPPAPGLSGDGKK